jgi:ribokinase
VAANEAGARVAVVGSLNMDLVARAPRMPQPGETLAGHAFNQVPGGKGGNQAVAAARLGAQVAMVGCVGSDANGAQLRKGLEAQRIDCAALETSTDAPTGVALIIVDDGSQNAIVIVAGSNGEVTPATIARHEAVLAAAEVVVCQLETPPQTVEAALAAAYNAHRIPARAGSPHLCFTPHARRFCARFISTLRSARHGFGCRASSLLQFDVRRL